jgi:hypothetical protein
MRARVAWAHDGMSDPTLAAAFQTLPGASFIVNGVTPAKIPRSRRRRRASPRQRRHAAGQIRRRVRSRSSAYAGAGTIRYVW